MWTSSLASAKRPTGLDSISCISRLEHPNINLMRMLWKGFKAKQMKYQSHLKLTEKLRRMKSSSSIKPFNERTSRKSWVWLRSIWKTFKMKITRLWRAYLNQSEASTSMLWVCSQEMPTTGMRRSTSLKRSSNMALNLHHMLTPDSYKTW